jgi:hypothetical protein
MGQKVEGDASGGIDGGFTYLAFGPSFQAGDGCFMEFELDLGTAKMHGSGKASGHSHDSGDSGSTEGDFDYNGAMGMLGMRWGWAF